MACLVAEPCLCAWVEALLRLDLWVCPPPGHTARRACERDVEEHAHRAVVNLGHKQAHERVALLGLSAAMPEQLYFRSRRTSWVRGRECQGGPTKTGMQPVRNASVRRWLDWLLPGSIRQKLLRVMFSSSCRCGCTRMAFGG